MRPLLRSQFMNNTRYYNITLLLVSVFYCADIKTHNPSLATFKHKSAAVLPLFKQENLDALNNMEINSCSNTDPSDTWVLLMREVEGKSDGGTYAPASGGAEKGETPLQTAAHEAFEELITQKTIGKNVHEIEHYLQPRRKHNHTTHIIVHDNDKKKSKNVTYITEFNHYMHAIHNNFYDALTREKKAAKAAGKKYSSFTEKDRLAYVKWDDLRKIIVNNPHSNHLEMEAWVVHPKTLELKRERIKLRPYFVVTVRDFFENKPYVKGKEPRVRFYHD